MKSVKLFVLLLSAVMMIASPALAKDKFKLAMSDVEGSDMWELCTRFKAVVESTSDMEIIVYPNSVMGSEQETVQNCRMGSIDMTVAAINNVTSFSKTAGILTLPYIMKSHGDAVKMTTGALGEFWRDTLIKEAGVRPLGWCYSNFRNLTNSKKPITSIEDLQGLKIRVPKNAQMIATYKSWGLSPVPMAWTETFTALQQRVVDGQDNPYLVCVSNKFYEVQKYITDLHYAYSLQPLMMSEKLYQKLTPEQQVIFIKAGIEAQQYNLLYTVTESAKAKATLIEKGMELSVLTDEDVWVKRAKDEVWPKFYDDFGGKEQVDNIVKMMAN